MGARLSEFNIISVCECGLSNRTMCICILDGANRVGSSAQRTRGDSQSIGNLNPNSTMWLHFILPHFHWLYFYFNKILFNFIQMRYRNSMAHPYRMLEFDMPRTILFNYDRYSIFTDIRIN